MNKLKETRTKQGLTQKALADVTGVNIRTIQHYEQDSLPIHTAHLETLLKFCIALKCRISDIIEDAETLELLEKYRKVKVHKKRE